MILTINFRDKSNMIINLDCVFAKDLETAFLHSKCTEIVCLGKRNMVNLERIKNAHIVTSKEVLQVK